MKIRKIEKIPSNCNGWGFGGAINIRHIEMVNGDLWRTGTACYRHLKSTKYIRLLRGATGEDGRLLDIDEELRGTAEKWLEKYYNLADGVTL